MAATVIAVLALSHLVFSQFIPPPTDLITKRGHAGVKVRYKEVPAGVCEQNPNVKSYSGYADVAPDQHIFWWFFEARNVDPSTAPLTVWINGGPGSSSMIGLFQELGPCTVNASGIAVDNPYSWSNASNMLFIDSPTQTGFSYSIPVPGYIDPSSENIITLPNNTCPDYAENWNCGTWSLPDMTLTANSTVTAAPNLYLTLQGFMGAFPQYSKSPNPQGRELFFATESYGGHYGPVFSQYFLRQNALALPGTIPLNLKGLLIGNGWFNPLLQYEAYYKYTIDPGNPYNTTFYNSSFQSLLYNNVYGKGNCLDQTRQCYATGRDDVCYAASSFCGDVVEAFMGDNANRDEYDTRYLMPDPFPPTYYVDYLNRSDVQKAIGAYVNFTESSNAVYTAFQSTGDDARQWNIASNVGDLIQKGIYVVIYYGDADYNCNILGGLSFLPLIHPPPPQNFHTKAGTTPILTSSSTTHKPRGTVRQASNFAFLRIYQSGHEVPFYQPELALSIFHRVLTGTDIATGKKDYKKVLTSGPLVDGYVEGNATVMTEVLEGVYEYDWVKGLPVPYGDATGEVEVEEEEEGDGVVPLADERGQGQKTFLAGVEERVVATDLRKRRRKRRNSAKPIH